MGTSPLSPPRGRVSVQVFSVQQLMAPGWWSQLCDRPRALCAGVRDKLLLLLGELMVWAASQGSPCASPVAVGLVPLRGLTLPSPAGSFHWFSHSHTIGRTCFLPAFSFKKGEIWVLALEGSICRHMGLGATAGSPQPASCSSLSQEKPPVQGRGENPGRGYPEEAAARMLPKGTRCPLSAVGQGVTES